MVAESDISGEVLEGLGSDDPEMRRHAAKTAGANVPAIRRARAVCDRLRAVVTRDSWAPAREWAAWALGRLSDRKAVPDLVAQLQDSNRDLKCYAAQALGEIGDLSAVGPLLSLLETDTDDICRSFVIDALGRLRQAPEARAALERLAADPAEPHAVRLHARQALSGLGLKNKPASDGVPGQLQIAGMDDDLTPAECPKALPGAVVSWRVVTTRQPRRNREVAEVTKRRRKHVCQVCGLPGFDTAAGLYAQAHHVTALAEGGADSPENLIVVCPTCHAMLHYARTVRYGYSDGETQPRTVEINGHTFVLKW
ncbi:MAG: HEAT repeat domain-containing protein [Armatimonadota bacterium]